MQFGSHGVKIELYCVTVILSCHLYNFTAIAQALWALIQFCMFSNQDVSLTTLHLLIMCHNLDRIRVLC